MRIPAPRRQSLAQVPEGCSLAPSLVEGRLDEWNSLLSRAEWATKQTHGVMLGLPGAVAEEVKRLVALEASCCSFLQIVTETDGDGVRLAVTTDAPQARAFLWEAVQRSEP